MTLLQAVRGGRAGLLATTTAVLLAACGGPAEPQSSETDAAGTTQAPASASDRCDELRAALSDAADRVRELVTDPAGAADDLTDVAEDLRAAGASVGGDVEAAANGLADLYDDLVAGLESGELPDISVVNERTSALAEACGV